MLCLAELCTKKNLVLSVGKSVQAALSRKTCRLHSSWRYLCRVEGRRNEFFQVLNRIDDGEEEAVEGQRCLCLQNNMLFGLREFRDSVGCSSCAPSTRSLLFFGPYHQYPTPLMDVGFKLLRELDALKLHFYTFPEEILTLVQLKYLALTCNGELPTAISKLFNLKILIIHPHINVKRCGDPLYVPRQIWNMEELEHIELLGKSLAAPNDGAILENLSTLVGVNANICTISKLLESIPLVRKLGVQIELGPYDDDSNLLSCFSRISALEDLETLKCSIVNPVFKCGYVAPSSPTSLMLPFGLKKLHLSGMGFPWECMDVIGSLPVLEVIKLRAYAFRGSKWETQEGSFRRLKFLLIQDSDLVQWKPRSRSFRELSYLSMQYCYKLEEFHWPSLRSQGKIELVNCNPLALTCAEQLELHGKHLSVTAFSTFDKKPIAIKLQR